MKRLYKISYIFIIALTLFACDDMLDGSPESFITTETFYNTIEEADIALSGAYSVINANNVAGRGNRNTFANGLLYMLNGGTDEMILRDGNDQVRPFGVASYNGEESHLIYNWYYWYAGINAVNILLDRPELMDVAEADENRKNEMIAEARFLRGIYHMYLAKMFGGIPVNTTAIADPMQERQSLEAVYTQVTEDLLYAYNNLNNRATHLGRADKWIAGAYLAKTYCYLGSCKTNNVSENLNFPLNSFQWVDANEMYSKALPILSDIERDGGYVLVEEYDRLFRATTSEDQRKECLFMAEANDNLTTRSTNNWYRILLGRGNYRQGGGPTDFLPTVELYKIYDAADIRRDHNLTDGLQRNPVPVDIDGYTYYTPFLIKDIDKAGRNYSQSKFRVQGIESRTFTDKFNTEGNFPLIRLADVLLLKAEAEYYTGDEPGARNTISKVRLRAAGNDTSVRDALDVAYNKSDFAEELLEERSRELCFECQRRFDLIRFGKHLEAVANLGPGSGQWNSEQQIAALKANWSGHDFKIWYPIPKDQATINTNLVQNPGY
nr:RagB/SusD family nutrient uptake outer membrane protein [uncultured Draconibacterium sp.]